MDDVVQILKDAGAILEGHFVGTSGKHLAVYINKNKILIHTEVTSKLCAAMAEKVAAWEPDIVVAPATGGIALSQWTAFHLGKLLSREVLSVYSEPVDGVQALSKRGYDEIVKDKRVVVVEDVVNTGKSIKEVVEAVRLASGNPVGAISLLNRNADDKTIEGLLGVPYTSLHHMPLDSYDEGSVPAWLKDIPIDTSVGHGAKYLKEHAS
jgi:orotate phosphoribosyltransferase